MPQTVVNAGTEEAYTQLKAQLTKKKCKIAFEQAPNSISAVQGSLWGTSPKAAQKKITFTLQQDVSGTTVTGNSKLTSGYIKLTLIGCALSIALMLVCVWIALDLQSYVSVGTAGVWNWLGQVNGHLDTEKATIFIRLDWILSAFLAATLTAEAVIVARVHAKIEIFVEEIIKNLH